MSTLSLISFIILYIMTCSIKLFNDFKQLNQEIIFDFNKYFFDLRSKLIEINEYNKIVYAYFNNIYEIENINLTEGDTIFLIFIDILKSTLYYNDYIIFVKKKQILNELKQKNPIKYGGSILLKLITILANISSIASFSEGNIDNFIKRETHPTFNMAIEKLSTNYDGFCVMNAITASIPSDKLISEISSNIFQEYKSKITSPTFNYGLSFRVPDYRIDTLSEIRDVLEDINIHHNFEKYNDLISCMIFLYNKDNDFNHQFNIFYNRHTKKIMFFDRNFQFPIEELTPYIFYEDNFFTQDQELLLDNKIQKIIDQDLLSFYTSKYDLPGTINRITIETIEHYDGVNLFSTSQEAISDINNFHLIRYYIFNPDITDINSVLIGGGSASQINSILKSNSSYFIIYCLYKNNRLTENSLIHFKLYKNFLNAIINKNNIVYIKYLICLLITNCSNEINKNGLLSLSKNIIKIEEKYNIYFNVFYDNINMIDELIITMSVNKINKMYKKYFNILNNFITNLLSELSFFYNCIQRLNNINISNINYINSNIDKRLHIKIKLINLPFQPTISNKYLKYKQKYNNYKLKVL